MASPSNNTASSGVYVPVTKGAALASGPCRSLWVGVAGTANLVDYDGITRTNVPLFQGLNPLACTAVNSGGTANDIWALY